MRAIVRPADIFILAAMGLLNLTLFRSPIVIGLGAC